MAELHPGIWRELRRLDQLDLLETGEIVCEHEFAILDTKPGALVLTDCRLLFSSTTLLGRTTRVLSVPLTEILEVHASAQRRILRQEGVLVVDRDLGGHTNELRFVGVPSGEQRAAEIARSILRQRDILAEGSSDPSADWGEQLSTDESPAQPRVEAGSGVSSLVRARGGKLYLWAESVGSAFDRVRASTERPHEVEFARLDEFEEFELFVECRSWTVPAISLRRSWLEMGNAVEADTGLSVE